MVVDFKYVQEEQKAFLKHLKHSEGISYQDNIFNVPMWLVLALQSELSEILNASKIHKWWDNQPVNREHLLEECADFLAHLGNLANILETDLVGGVEELQITAVESQINYLAYKITTLPWKKQFARSSLLNNLLPKYVELVYSLGFNLDELKEAYLSKMERNYIRFASGEMVIKCLNK